MSVYGGPLTRDIEREERRVDSEEGWEDGDGWATQPSEKCTRQAPPLVGGQPNRGPCPGRMADGADGVARCDWCGRPKRTVER